MPDSDRTTLSPTHEAAIDRLEREVANLRRANDELLKLTLHMCADCKHQLHECVCSEAVNKNTSIMGK